MEVSTHGVNNPAGHHTQTKLPGGSVETHVCPLMKAWRQSGLGSGLAHLCMCACSVAQAWLFATPWTVARWAPLSMGFSGQEYWSGLPCPPPGDLPDPEIEPAFPASPALWVVVSWELPIISTHLGEGVSGPHTRKDE